MSNWEKVKEGDLVVLNDHKDGTIKIQAGCENVDGYWYCCTHLYKDQNSSFVPGVIHFEDGASHLVAWFCKEHNCLEVP